jgi:hypothetical protein
MARSAVSTAWIVSDVASAPGVRSVSTWRGAVGSDASMTATPQSLSGDDGPNSDPGPETYAQSPAHAMLALPPRGVGSAPTTRWIGVWPTNDSPQL